MRADRLCSLALGAALVAVLVPAPASGADGWGEGYFFAGTGFRASGTIEQAGLSFNVGGGVFAGPFGLEIEGRWSADQTFKEADERVAARSTNYLTFQLGIPATESVRIVVFGGPGLGWIKPGGQIGGRTVSAGVHEGVRIELARRRDEVFAGVGIKLEANHLWQDAVIDGVDHAFALHLQFLFGFGID